MAMAAKRSTPANLLKRVAGSMPGDKRIERALTDCIRSYVKQGSISYHTRHKLGFEIASARAVADFVGRAGMRLDRRGPRPVQFSATFVAEPTLGLTDITGTEAYKDIINREPVLARSAAEVEHAYMNDRMIIAFAHSPTETLTKQIQDQIAKAMRVGEPVTRASQLIARMGDWTLAYSENVFRTNTNTSYNAGRMREASLMESDGLLVALKYSATLDSNVRPNHRAANGVIAGPNDKIWDSVTPPLGFNCAPCNTLVMTGDGEKRIDEIEPGDLVLTHRNRFRPVVYVHRQRFSGDLVGIGAGERKLSLTPNHEVFQGRDLWAQAGRLKPRGPLFLARHGDLLPEPISSIGCVPYTDSVYNLSVEEDESFCAEGIVVHNCRCALVPVDELDIPKSLVRNGKMRVLGRPPRGAGPDSPGFGGRRDAGIY